MKNDVSSSIPSPASRRLERPEFLSSVRFFRYLQAIRPQPSFYVWPVCLALFAGLLLPLANPRPVNAQSAGDSRFENQPERTRPIARTMRALNQGRPNWFGEDYAPRISPDGRFLIFQSDRPGAKNGHNLWISINQNYRRPAEAANWTTPTPLFFPLMGRGSETMRVVTGKSFTVNTDGFEGMPALLYAGRLPPGIILHLSASHALF